MDPILNDEQFSLHYESQGKENGFEEIVRHEDVKSAIQHGVPGI